MTEGILIPGIVGILLAGLLTAARAVLISTDHDALRAHCRDGKGWACRGLAFIEQPERLFNASHLGVDLSLLMSGTLVVATAWEIWGCLWAITAAAGLLVGFLLVGALFPQALAAKSPSRWVPLMAWVISLAHWGFTPWALLQRASMVLGRGGLEGKKQLDAISVSRQELSWLLRGDEEGGEFFQEERKMIDRIFHFSETQVREVMIPLIEVSAIEENAKVLDVIRRVDQEGYSRFPVYRERIDRVLGIIHSFDFLDLSSLDEPVGRYVRKTPFVPESMPVDELMLQLQRGGNHMAIVVDEYGGAVGIVTMEDLLEEIVGEIEDEHDIQKVSHRKLSTHQFLVSARMEIDEVNELLGLELPKDDYETLGGFLMKAFRRIPKQEESLIFREIRFTVQKADERSVKEVLITLPRKRENEKKNS